MYQVSLPTAAGTHPQPHAPIAPLQVGGFSAILLPMSIRPNHLPLLAGVLGLLGLALGLSNPGMADFEGFAADRLVEEIAEELCVESDLPLLLTLAIGNCERMVRDQRGPLAAVVQQHTSRTNLGLVSLFRSEIGGQRLLAWRVPRFHALVLGVAGQFVVVHAGQSNAAADADPLDWLGP